MKENFINNGIDFAIIIYIYKADIGRFKYQKII